MKKVFIGYLVFVFLLSSVAYTFEQPDGGEILREAEADRVRAEVDRVRKQQAAIEKNRREPIDAIENLTNEIKLLREAVERIERKMPINPSAQKKAFDPTFRGHLRLFEPTPAGGKTRVYKYE